MIGTLTVDIEKMLRFFDERVPWGRNDATAVVAAAGEDLGIGLLCHYLGAQNLQAEPLEGPCTTGKRRGPRLDRWVRVTTKSGTTLYQVEVKNWSAHAVGGEQLALDASTTEIAEYKKRCWQGAWNEAAGAFHSAGEQKVLVQMRAPEPCDVQEPLLCYWSAMHATGAEEPLFSHAVQSPWCSRVWVFSMSSYLRRLYTQGQHRLSLAMPEGARRIQLLQELFPTRDG